MFDGFAQVGLAIALVLPGFIVVQLSERRRPSKPAGGDLELVLRGLVYALIIQTIGIVTTWLPDVLEDLKGDNWTAHLDAAAIYGVVLGVIVPTALGIVLGNVLRAAEAQGSLATWHYALGARDARRGWDYGFSRNDGAWVRIHLKDPDKNGPRSLIGRFGRDSWASQSPADPDLYLQEAWPADEAGQITEDALSAGSSALWVDGEQVARLEFSPGEE